MGVLTNDNKQLTSALVRRVTEAELVSDVLPFIYDCQYVEIFITAEEVK